MTAKETGSGATANRVDETWVKIFAKAVAAGTSDVADEGVADKPLNVVIQFMPRPVPVGELGGFKLSEWPTQVRNMLQEKEFKLSVNCTALKNGQSNKPTFALKQMQGALQAHSGNVAKITSLWQKVFETFEPTEFNKLPDGTYPPVGTDTPWALLENALRQSFAGEKWKVKSAEPDKTIISVTNVRSNRQHEQAVRLEILRVHEVLNSIAGTAEAEEEAAVRAQCKTETPATPEYKPPKFELPPHTAEQDRADAHAALAKERVKELALIKDSLNKPINPKHPADLSYVELCKDLDDPLASHAYTTWYNRVEEKKTETAPAQVQGGAAADPPPPPDDIPPDPRSEFIEQRFFNLQSSPALSRLFMLAFDAEEAVDSTVHLEDGIYHLSVDQAETPKFHKSIVKTLAKIDTMTAKGKTLFWPALRAETDPTLCEGPDAAHVLDQSNGVVFLGMGGGKKGRFDITSLDVRSAAEHAYERSRRRSSASPEEIAKIARSTVQRETLMTAGLTILDGGRKEAIDRRLKARNEQIEGGDSKDIVLDADDLLQGYRIDVGVGHNDATGPATRWRSLMNRVVDYVPSGKGELPGTSLPGLMQAIFGTRRKDIVAAVLSPYLQFAAPPTAEAKEPAKLEGEVDGLVSDIVAVWDGGPMAVDCAGSPDDKKDFEDMPFGRIISLPAEPSEDPDKPNLLRFGRAYQVAMRAVYQGGLAIDLATSQSIHHTCKNAVLPPANGEIGAYLPYRRFLRHERILQPHLLMPGMVAFQANGPMGFENTRHAVVRSYLPPPRPLSNADSHRAQPTVTTRYFMPPDVPQAFAALHGIFDSVTGKEKVPNGSGEVFINSLKGGFPAAAAVIYKGLNAEPYLSKRSADPNPTSTAEPFLTTVEGISGFVSDGPFRYFADPLAESYVVALRHAGTDQYLDGTPLVVVLRDDSRNLRYNNVLPLKVTIKKRGARPKTEMLTTANVLGPPDGRKINVSENLPGSVPHSGTVRRISAMEVEVSLSPGDDFEMDVWCIPSAENMAKNLALVEMLGAVAMHNGAEPAPLNQAARLANGFRKILSKPDYILKELGKSGTYKNSFAGPYGMTVPDKLALQDIAAALVEKIKERPVSEISSVQTLRVTHAVNLPAIPPTFVDSLAGTEKDELRKIIIARLNRQNFEALSLADSDSRFESFIGKVNPRAKKMPIIPYIDPGSHDYALGGHILIDLDTSSGFEIVAKTAFPRSPLFDNKDRKRSSADRRSGTWPVDHAALNDEWGPDAKWIPSASLYGFHIFSDGRIEFPRNSVTLLRVSDLRSARVSDQPAIHNNLEVIALEQLYGIMDGGQYYRSVFGDTKDSQQQNCKPIPAVLQGAQVHLEHAFPDGKARELELKIRSISRFAGLMSTVTHDNERGDVSVGEPLMDGEDSLSSSTVTVWLPATSAPAAPRTRSPVPVFVWHGPHVTRDPETKSVTYTVTRTSLTRIPLKREWFSSGEDERLGIVLWPPNLFDSGANLSNDDVVLEPAPESPAGEEPRKVSLRDFVDEDLGPGGAFITRWGGDPIRSSDGGQVGNFIPASQFDDYRRTPSVEGPWLVPKVYMPVGSPLGSTETRDKNGKPLLVSLLTFAPRFDADREEWYVDVNIVPGDAPDPFVRLGLVRFQEHAPPELQVSEPVVEWTQLLPKRVVAVEVLQRGRGLNVTVDVTGQAATGLKVSKTNHSHDDDLSQSPTVKIKLYAETGVGAKIQLRETVREITVDNLDPTQFKRHDEYSVWRYEFGNVQLPVDIAFAGGKLFAHVEEVEMRQKASFVQEPLPVLDGNFSYAEGEYRESGPRFVARVEIPIDWDAAKKVQLEDKS